jgi:hypothetical protein
MKDNATSFIKDNFGRDSWGIRLIRYGPDRIPIKSNPVMMGKWIL